MVCETFRSLKVVGIIFVTVLTYPLITGLYLIGVQTPTVFPNCFERHRKGITEYHRAIDIFFTERNGSIRTNVQIPLEVPTGISLQRRNIGRATVGQLPAKVVVFLNKRLGFPFFP